MNIFKLIFNLLLPAHCSICGRELFYYEKHFCLECYSNMPLTYFWEQEINPAEKTFWGRCYIEKVFCLYIYTSNYRKPIHLLKYKGNISIGLYLGEMLGKKISFPDESISPITHLVPVPLHWRKKLSRGYNQSQIIAEGILKGIKESSGSKKGPVILPELLVRKAFTKTQTKKERIDRWQNVKNAFAINKKSAKVITPADHILLIDDVLTTGATLEACATLLLEHCGCRVSIATLAYVE
ncbi:MAG: phosphoribosyltransferase family protein [Bacteroidia bacterium]|nr:phosphoribosyltransferase family protein [Bacteroidia bacterium]